MELTKYDQACRAIAEAKSVIAEAKSIDEAKHIRDMSAAMRTYARQAKNRQMEIDACEIRMRAERKLGQLIVQQKKTVGLNSGTRGQFIGPSKLGGPMDDRPTLVKAGIDWKLSSRAQQLAAIPDDRFESCVKNWREEATIGSERIAIGLIRQMRDDEKKADLHREIHIRSTGIRVGDFRELSAEILDDSVELIFTDPPYDRDSLPLYETAASIGARILKPGGSLIAYAGQYLLPDILPAMRRHLRYWWLNARVYGGGPKARMNEYGLVVGWKPMLWFVKEYRGDRQTFVDDVVVGGPREKSYHEWQQPERDADYFIRKLTSPRGLVVDFFCGSGTTCVVAEKLGRPWIAFEIDPITAKKADERISNSKHEWI